MEKNGWKSGCLKFDRYLAVNNQMRAGEGWAAEAIRFLKLEER